MNNIKQIVNNLKEIIGKGYNAFWHCKKRYRVVKGSRGSKKSCTTAIWLIENMMKMYDVYKLKPHALCIRRYMNTNFNSTRAQLVWAINKLGVRHLWKVPKSEHTLTYIPSGQTILFRGMDDVQSITSITVEDGYLCWVWIEEAFQITSESDFNKVDMSIRGKLPEPLFHQITLTFNPWSDKSWLKRRFFDTKDEDVFALTTTYKCNEFLGESDIKMYEKMKEQNPKRYRIEGEGEWGISEGLIIENWRVEEFNIEKLVEEHNQERDGRGHLTFVACNGMDFGYTDPTAFVAMFVDKQRYKIYVYFDMCEVLMENRRIANKLISEGFQRSEIKADSEDPRTINELKLLGLYGIKGAKKGSGSVLGGIQKMQDYEIIVHPRCTNTQIALSNYAWKKDKQTDQIMPVPEHEFSHIPDAMRYGLEDISKFGVEV